MFQRSQLTELGLQTMGNVYYNYSVARLVEMALLRGEGELAANGALVVKTGERTGRSPNDKYIIKDNVTEDKVWWGNVNKPTDKTKAAHLFEKINAYLKDKDLFAFDAFCGADKKYQLPVRVITEKAWHSLFAETLFIRPTVADLADFKPGFTIINAGDLKLDPEKDGFDSPVAVVVDFSRNIILIAGTNYGGEIKKALFSVMNFLLPERNVFPMHCSSNVGENGDSALFFGLSGTGKTTLSADPLRRLIGDDEHGWSDDGVFNFEGGCYAKCIRLSKEAEPQIYDAIRFGSILENVTMDDKTRVIDFDSAVITENTRATYPVEYIPNCLLEGRGDHPKNIFFLTCDAFGVLPPISKLNPEMAMYHFISGYTAKVAGTEVGVKEPSATFSACFGAPFLPLHPAKYAELLGQKLKKHNANCWLVNTGWSGGAFGVGSRMKISITRGLLNAALDGSLNNVVYKPHPIFKVLVPQSCAGIDPKVLNPDDTWKDKNEYEKTARKLEGLFIENYKKYS